MAQIFIQNMKLQNMENHIREDMKTSWAEQGHTRDQLFAFPPLPRPSYRIFLTLAIIHVGGWLDRLTENNASLASLRVSPLGRVWQ